LKSKKGVLVMPRYHISINNEVVTCYAKIKCRRARPEEHFENKEEALAYVDKLNELESDYISISRQEPYITKKISDIVDKIDSCFLDGLEYRTKSLSSTREKVLIRKEVNSINELFDVVRYTAVSKTKNYIKNKDKILKDLEEKGFTIYKEKNTWLRNGYKGINVKLISPNNIKFELQFHTEQSLEAKEKVHKYYEEQRLPSTTEERKRELAIIMNQIFNEIPNPYE
jgi:hypothetical protein